MKIMSVVGARPEFIQANPVSKEIRKKHNEILVHTGQHYDYVMSKTFFDELGIPEPDYNLGIGSHRHAVQTGKMLIELEQVCIDEKPDCIIVRGDTNSTLAGALAAVKLHIPVIHIEAGERCFQRWQPEEINRITTDHLSDLLLCITSRAVEHLKNEGIHRNVYNTGDVMYDSLIQNLPKAEKRSQILERLMIKPRDYVLATVHRADNTDDTQNLLAILNAFNMLKQYIVFPVHPRTRSIINQLNYSVAEHVKLLDPVSYYDILVLEKNARKIVTDSGGILREAYMLGVPCITLQETIAVMMTVDNGWNVLVGSDTNKITEAINNFNPSCFRPSIFGDGNAAEKIVQRIEQFLS